MAELAGGKIHGRKGVEVYSLRLSVELRPTFLNETSKDISLSNFDAVVECSPPGMAKQYLSRAVPEAPLTILAQEHPQSSWLMFNADLEPEQFGALEKLRGGGGLDFDLAMTCEARHPDHTYPAHYRISFCCDLSAWSRVLDQLDYSSLMVVGISLPRLGSTSVFRRMDPGATSSTYAV